MDKSITVIIVNWNTRELLQKCLVSIEAECERSGFDNVETIVVDNASTDGSPAMVRQLHSWVELIENNSNLGFARANNQALQRSTGEYILLLNSDAELGEGALVKMAAALDADDLAGAVGPQVYGPDGAKQNCYGSLPSILGELVGPYRFDSMLRLGHRLRRPFAPREVLNMTCVEADRVSFACTMVRRAALDSVGLLDESFEFYSEDYDWFYRLKSAGWRALFCPSATAVHVWGASSVQRNEWALRQLYRSKRLYFRKHQGALAERLLRAGLGARFMVKVAILWAKALFPSEESVSELRVYRALLLSMLFESLGKDAVVEEQGEL